MKTAVFLLFFLAACSVAEDDRNTYSDLPEILKEKALKYPAFDIRISGFRVTPEFPDIPSDSQDKIDSQILTIEEKRFFLRAVDQIRFAVNTPEFFERMKNRTFIAAEDFSGPNGSIKAGEAYPDNERLYNVIKAKVGSAFITKLRLDSSIIAQANLPERDGKIINAYVAADNDPIFDNIYHVQINNRKKWNSPEFITINGSTQIDSFFQNIVFHELLHNLGFSHQSVVDINTDTVYQLGTIMEELLSDPEWKARYSKELASFEPFYPILHQNYLTSNTLASMRSMQNEDDLIFIPLTSPQTHSSNAPIIEKGYYTNKDGSKQLFIRESFVFPH